MLKVTRITGNAGSGKTSVLSAIETDIHSQGRHTARICAGHGGEYVARRAKEYAEATTTRFPLVILLDEASEATIDAARDAIGSRDGFLFAAITAQ